MHARMIIGKGNAPYKGFYVNPNAERSHVRIFINSAAETKRLTDILDTKRIPYTLDTSGDNFMRASLDAAASHSRRLEITRDYACLITCYVIRIDNLHQYLFEVAKLLPHDMIAPRASYDFLMIVKEFTDISAYDFLDTFFNFHTMYSDHGADPISQDEIMLFALCKKPSDPEERNKVLDEIRRPASRSMGQI